jgi:glycosyltransferase involved in cell wall biosynthesis
MTAKDQESPPARRDSGRTRVAQCIHGLGVGGAQQVVRFIASDGAPERFEHFVPPHGGAFLPYLKDAGATIRIVERMVPKFDPVWIGRLARQLRADDIDVLAFASDYEGLSLSMLEVMASSVCLVTTDAPGICDILADEKNALLVPIRDVPALSSALLRVLSDDGLRPRLGAAGRDTFYNNYTARHMAQRYEDIYLDVTNTHNAT